MLQRALLAIVFALAGAAAAQASNLDTPNYPLNANEQLYADLFRLPPAERHQKIVEGARKEDRYEMIYGFNGALGENYFDLFKKTYPFVKASGLFLSSIESNPRIIAEETARRHITDVLSGTGIMDTNLGLERGVFARYPTPQASKILPQYRRFADPHNRWLLNHWEERGISYNSEALKRIGAAPPASWFDLCRPEFKHQVSFDPPRDNFLHFFRAMFGDEKFAEWAKCMGANQPIILDGQTLRLNLMMAGDHAIQGMNFFYVGALMRDTQGSEKAPFAPVYTAPIMASGNGCLINRNTPHPYTAALFCDWTLDDEPQAFIKKNYRGPVTLPHPFLPADAPLVPILPQPPGAADGLYKIWNAAIQSTNR
jgi:ABC-type Fe3+ transport system substrate-binding protein